MSRNGYTYQHLRVQPEYSSVSERTRANKLSSLAAEREIVAKLRNLRGTKAGLRLTGYLWQIK